MCGLSLFRYGLLVALGVIPGLFGNQFAVREVVYAHGMAYTAECLGSLFASRFAALFQYFVHGRDIFLELFAAGTYGSQFLLQNSFEEFLHLHVAQSAAAVVGLQLVEVGIFGQICGKMFGTAEGVEVREYRISLYLPGSDTRRWSGSVYIDFTRLLTSFSVSER